MDIFLDESACREKLFPFTYTRHTSRIRIGILTIAEKWEHLGYLVHLNPAIIPPSTVTVPANLIPCEETHERIVNGNKAGVPAIHYPWHIFQLNDWALRQDFELLTRGRTPAALPAGNQCTNPSAIFIEDGATIEHSILNAATGPIYIGRNACVMDGSLIRGPFAAGENAVIKMGAKIYGASSIGPNCTAGGEIKNSILFANSNKAHDGYLGDSVLGEWCNLGAGSSNSNVKNTAGLVKYIIDRSGQQHIAGNKAGLLMGDYSRCAINTSFNTGTIVGVCCNIFGAGQPPKYVENFSWGQERYIFDKALEDIANWKKMKGQFLSEEEIEILKKIYNQL